MPNSTGQRSSSQESATRWARWTVAVTLLVGILLIGLDVYRTGWAPLGPAQSTTTTKTTTENKSTRTGTGSTERREVTTASKETTVERALGQPGLWLVRLLIVVLVAFFSGAAVQRILLGEFSLKIGPVEVPPLPAVPPEPLSSVPEQLVDALKGAEMAVGMAVEQVPQESVITSSSYVMDLLNKIQEAGPADYAVIDIKTGNSWLTTRLFLFAILLQRMQALRTFVFVDTRGRISRRFVGVAAPEIVRWRLAREYPWLERAFAQAYCSIQSPNIQSDSGALEPFVAGRLVEEFMRQPEIQGPERGPGDDWVQLPPNIWEHARWVNQRSSRLRRSIRCGVSRACGATCPYRDWTSWSRFSCWVP